MNNSMILLEFNELVPRLMNDFIEAGHLPSFARLREESQCFITDAGEAPPNLEPWIQWITVHSGLTASEHSVFNLGDSRSVSKDAIWDVASQHHQRVWVCGSMNAFYRPGINGWVLPDPWSIQVAPNSEELKPYLDFVRSQVLEYTRAESRYKLAEAAPFVRFMLSHGLRMKTCVSIIGQLLRERFEDIRWRRPTILDRLQFDLFRYVYRNERPILSTFFLNSTAHFQHCYWRNLEPEAFSISPDADDQALHEDAILFGYKSMDRIVGEVFEMAGDRAVIVLASALSQQPCLKYEESGGKTFYKPEAYSALLRAVGLDGRDCTVEPVMSEQFHLRFRSNADAADAVAKFEAATVDGRPVFSCERNGSSLIVGCAIFSELRSDATFVSPVGKHRFFDLFYGVDTRKSGMHHPDGLLWIRIPEKPGRLHENRVPLVNVAPTLLALLGLPVPASMSGRSLFPNTENHEVARNARASGF